MSIQNRCLSANSLFRLFFSLTFFFKSFNFYLFLVKFVNLKPCFFLILFVECQLHKSMRMIIIEIVSCLGMNATVLTQSTNKNVYIIDMIKIIFLN